MFSAIKGFLGGGLIPKVMTGAVVVLLLALTFLFNSLMSSQRARGALAAEVSEAAGINARMALAKDAIEKNRDEVLAKMDAERKRADAATQGLIESQKLLDAAQTDFERRLQLATLELSDEEMLCAMQPIPDALIDSLRE